MNLTYQIIQERRIGEVEIFEMKPPSKAATILVNPAPAPNSNTLLFDINGIT